MTHKKFVDIFSDYINYTPYIGESDKELLSNLISAEKARKDYDEQIEMTQLARKLLLYLDNKVIKSEKARNLEIDREFDLQKQALKIMDNNRTFDPKDGWVNRHKIEPNIGDKITILTYDGHEKEGVFAVSDISDYEVKSGGSTYHAFVNTDGGFVYYKNLN